MNYYTVHYTLDFEPYSIQTLRGLIELSSPFRPMIRIENWGFDDCGVLGDVPVALDEANSFIYVLFSDRIYKLKHFHFEPVDGERYGNQIFDFIKITDHQYIILDDKIGLDFESMEASYNLYIKLLGRNIGLAHDLDLL